MSSKSSTSGIAYLVVAAVIFLILVVCAFGSFYQVDQGERGVVLRNLDASPPSERFRSAKSSALKPRKPSST